ncbi:hypothetical protein HID58_055116 [Brassica napus]|uniref:Uncharacterized protein n=1 Tax=Brassica napus TaxID=3708 RepID=A0ABQ8AKA2_BRANA|nr:hypothetical protein HID58_055116 [Brassica napus]
MCIQSNLQAKRRFLFSDLKSGKCTSVVEARLLRFWEARNVKRGGELMWVDMLLVDVNVSLLLIAVLIFFAYGHQIVDMINGLVVWKETNEAKLLRAEISCGWNQH